MTGTVVAANRDGEAISKLVIRCPVEVATQVRELARRERRTLSAEIVSLLEQAMRKEEDSASA